MLKQLICVAGIIALLIASPSGASEKVEIVPVDIGALYCRKHPNIDCTGYKGQIAYYAVDTKDRSQVHAVFFLAYNPWNHVSGNVLLSPLHIKPMEKVFNGLFLLAQTYSELAGLGSDEEFKITSDLMIHYQSLRFLRPKDQRITIHSQGENSLVMTITDGEKVEFRAN